MRQIHRRKVDRRKLMKIVLVYAFALIASLVAEGGLFAKHASVASADSAKASGLDSKANSLSNLFPKQSQ